MVAYAARHRVACSKTRKRMSAVVVVVVVVEEEEEEGTYMQLQPQRL